MINLLSLNLIVFYNNFQLWECVLHDEVWLHKLLIFIQQKDVLLEDGII